VASTKPAFEVRARELRFELEHAFGNRACAFEQRDVGYQIGKTQQRYPALARAEQLTRVRAA
jgi:hypothetical protein